MANMDIGNTKFVLGERTYIMGILNVTPDSFSDGGSYTSIEKALSRARQMVDEGADILDVGGESTRPNHTFVPAEEEIARVIPVIKAIQAELDVAVSIDTYKAKVAEEAIKAGASLINDVWGFKYDPQMADVASQYGAACCLMHNRDNHDYNNLLEDILKDLEESIDIALKAGVNKNKIMIDPGIGFAKTYKQNLLVMKNLEIFQRLGFPVLLGTSRKSMIGNTLNLPPEERIEGTLATTVLGIVKQCDFVRVHDIKENKRAAVMTDAILRS